VLRGYPKYESGNCGYDEDYIEGYDYCAACHSRIKSNYWRNKYDTQR